MNEVYVHGDHGPEGGAYCSWCDSFWDEAHFVDTRHPETMQSLYDRSLDEFERRVAGGQVLERSAGMSDLQIRWSTKRAAFGSPGKPVMNDPHLVLSRAPALNRVNWHQGIAVTKICSRRRKVRLIQTAALLGSP